MSLELQNAANFSLQYSNSIPAVELAVIAGKTYYAKLTELIISTTFDKPVISLAISTTVPVGKIWEYAGRIRQVVETGLGDSIVEEHNLSLVERNLIIFSKISNNYTLRYKPPKWFISLNIGIYQYDRDDIVSGDAAITQEFTNLNIKLDQIATVVESTEELIGG